MSLNYLLFYLPEMCIFLYFLLIYFWPDPRDDLGGMDVARKVRYPTISQSLSCFLFVAPLFSEENCYVLHELLPCWVVEFSLFYLDLSEKAYKYNHYCNAPVQVGYVKHCLYSSLIPSWFFMVTSS